MKIDIIISILNGAEFIEESIKSILDQTYKNWRLFLIDNGSTDNTFEILKEYEFDHRDKIFVSKYEENQKPSVRWLEKIKESSADAIAISCHDDIWMKDKLQAQVDVMITRKVDVVHTNVEIIDAFGNTLEGQAQKENHYRDKIDYESMNKIDLANEFCRNNSIRLSSVLIDNNTFKTFGGWEKGIWGGEDWGMWIKFALNGCKFYHIKKSLVLRRVHSKNASSSSRYIRSFGFLKAIEIASNNYPVLKDEIRKKEVLIHKRIVYESLKNEKYQNARRYSNYFLRKERRSLRDVLFALFGYSGIIGHIFLRLRGNKQ